MQTSRITPAEAIRILQEGNARYVSGQSLHPNASRERRDITSRGQQPFATVLACADSRVPVEMIFDQGIGDVFVVRVAGNVLEPGLTGSVEYSVEHLEVATFIVLGHTNCGAVKAVYQEGLLEGNLRGLSEKILPAVASIKQNNPGLDESSGVDEAAKLNVWNAIEDAFRTSRILADKTRARQLKIVGAFYDLVTGHIEWMGMHPRQDQLVG